MADENLRSRHAFGESTGVDNALAQNKIDAHDILFLDENTDPKIGWITKEGKKVIIENKNQVVFCPNALPETGEEAVVYIYASKLYLWDGEKFYSPTDEGGIDEATVNEKVEAAVHSANTYADEKVEKVESTLDECLSEIDSFERSYEKVMYELAHKPVGTLVNHRDKEIRIMCPTNTEWVLQQSGEGANSNMYYIGFKAYAPSEDVMSFKEDLAEIISDNTMYYFEGNNFAGIEDDGRKYSIVWLPAAVYDEANDTWTYYGANSSVEKYIGWYYSVEWYNADGVVVSSDCIRINLSNEQCHNAIKPSYVNDAVTAANAYTDEQIANAIAVIEF